MEKNPVGFSLLGDSKSCKSEALISNDGRIFTTQFHWEYYVSYYIKLYDLWWSNKYDCKYVPRVYRMDGISEEAIKNV